MKRDATIELFRCLLMYGICLLHCVHSSGYSTVLESLLLPCVNGFVFISGWFGIRFSPSKVLRLYGVQLYCVSVMLICGEHGVSFGKIAEEMTKFWFGHAYVLMMLLAPLVNNAIDRAELTGKWRDCFGTIVPLFCAVFVWGYSARVPLVRQFTPSVHGLDDFSGLTLLATYAGARLCRVVQVEKKISGLRLVLVAVVLAVTIAVFRLGTYNSPFAFAFSAAIFLLFCRSCFPVSPFVSKIVLLISPSMFSVFFFHLGSGFVGIEKMLTMSSQLRDACLLPYGVVLPLSVFVFYVACVLLDMPRRLMVSLLRVPVGWICSFVDNAYAWLVERFAERCAR